MQPTVVTL